MLYCASYCLNVLFLRFNIILGYPDRLAGTEIPEQARIIGVADAYDAMTSKRSYRNILSQEVVRGEIERGRCTQFDPVFADIMIQMIDDDIRYTMRERGKEEIIDQHL